MNNIVGAVTSLGAMGLCFGALLAYASRVFAVEIDERVPKICEVLPNANCGGCGFAGCSAFASAIVEGKAKLNGCPVGGNSCAQAIAEIMGMTAEVSEPMAARVLCHGTDENAVAKYTYHGVNDCVAASRLAGGYKSCPNACLGLGTCASVCKFGAINMVDGVAVVDKEKCTACGMCVEACPKKVIAMVPVKNDVYVGCNSHEKGADARKNCAVSCIGCKICEKNCPEGAITVNDNIAVIDYTKCTKCGKCVEKCPRKCIYM
jgi:electron transport complex protein RnfB